MFQYLYIKLLLFFTFLFLFLLASCSPREPIPDEFPDKEEMAGIIADLYIAENVIRRSPSGQEGDSSDTNIPGYYKGVLEEYGMAAAEFDTIRKWYAAHPHHYQEVYDRVIVKISRREAELEQKIREEKETEEARPQIIDLWEKERSFTINSGDTIGRKSAYHVKLDSLTGGEIRFKTVYKFLKDHMTEVPRMMMIVEYSDTIADTITRELEMTFQPRNITLSAEMDSTMPATGVSGLMFDHDTTSSSTAIEFTGIRLEHLPESIKAGAEIERTPRIERPDLPE